MKVKTHAMCEQLWSEGHGKEAIHTNKVVLC